MISFFLFFKHIFAYGHIDIFHAWWKLSCLWTKTYTIHWQKFLSLFPPFPCASAAGSLRVATSHALCCTSQLLASLLARAYSCISDCQLCLTQHVHSLRPRLFLNMLTSFQSGLVPVPKDPLFFLLINRKRTCQRKSYRRSTHEKVKCFIHFGRVPNRNNPFCFSGSTWHTWKQI